LKGRGQDGQSETEQPDHSVSLGDSITSSNTDRVFRTHSTLCLVRDVQGEGGTWMPGALMGPALRKRLKERAGLTFSAR
jgi:short subunit dehydrogenase-like uncharacterized protein